MQTLTVDLGERSYPIHIGLAILQDADLLRPYLASNKVAVVSNTTVAPLYLKSLRTALAGYELTEIVLPDGEAFKNWQTLQLIFDALLADKHDRKTTLIALGGGVTGDMTGFAAACYQRGVNFIQCPYFASQVDFQ